MNIAEVIGWKFNHQPGMKCKEIDGVLQIVEFPGGIPSQADQDLWTAEYNARDIQAENDAIIEEIYDQAIMNSRVLKALILALNDGSFVPGSGYTNQQIKNGIIARM